MYILMESYKAGLFAKKYWLNNIIAGVIVGIVALPLAMAFAIASGAKPEQGLYTAIVAGLLVSLFGGSRLQIAGPTGAFIVVLAAINAKYGMDGLQIATMMGGCMLLFLGMARLGSVIKFIPAPVILGFTAGIAVVIWVGQWAYFFGLPLPEGAHFHEKFWHLLLSFPHMHGATTALACLSLMLVIWGNKIPGLARVPTPLMALLAGTFVQSYFVLPGVATIGNTFGGIPMGLPSFSIPALSLDRILELVGPAFTIAMLGAIESLLSAVVADGMSGTRHHSNQELIGQGLANIVAPMFGGFAATGAIARTATNIRNGANSPLAGVVHAITLILIILFLAPFAVNIPLASLAAILFLVAWNMSEVKHVIALMKRAPRADIIILMVTFFLTIFVDLVVAVNIGVILAILHFLRTMALSVEVQEISSHDLSRELTQDDTQLTLPDDVLVYAIDGPFFFAAIETFERALIHIHKEPRILILQMRRVPFIDMTAIQTLEEVIKDLQARAVRVMLCAATTRVKTKLRKAGVLDLIGPDNIKKDLIEAVRACHQ